MIKNKAAKIIILIIAMAVTAVTIFFYVRSNSRHNRLLSECDSTTTGVVYTQRSTGRSTFSSKNFGAQFNVDGGTYHTYGVNDIEPQYGETVQIHYKSTDPSVAYAGSRPTKMNTFEMIIFVFFGVMTSYAMINLLVKGE